MHKTNNPQSHTKFKTWGKSRSNRLQNYDYSSDRPIHITICTKDKKQIYYTDKAEAIIKELLKVTRDLQFRILCYCLMPDHLHTVISPGDSSLSLSEFMRTFKGRTATIFREKHGLSNLWQRSSFDHVIRADEDLKVIIEYILNNPVRKGITVNAEDYPYSKWFEEEVSRYLYV